MTPAGEPFPGRDLVVFLAFCVILITLVGQGLSLPFAIRLLGLEADAAGVEEEAKARIGAAEAGLARLDELVPEGWVREDMAGRVRGMYAFRLSRFSARFDDGDDGAIEDARPPTSGCGASCSRLNAVRSSSSAGSAGSATRS